MKSNLFFGCTSKGEVQLRFDELSKVFNDQDEMLNTIKVEYSTLMSVLAESKLDEAVEEKANVSEKTVEIVKEKATVTEKIKELQGKIDPAGLHLEICGTWLWVTGKTYPVRDTLKELGFRYSSNKLCWYYRQFDPKVGIDHRSGNQEPVPLEMIREKYGASVVAL